MTTTWIFSMWRIQKLQYLGNSIMYLAIKLNSQRICFQLKVFFPPLILSSITAVKNRNWNWSKARPFVILQKCENG